MIEHKAIVDKQGNLIDGCVEYKKGELINFILNEGQIIVPTIYGNFIKPHWTGKLWVEGATGEEISIWKEENMVVENTEENLIDKLILDNINMQIQIDSLIEISLGGK